MKRNVFFKRILSLIVTTLLLCTLLTTSLFLLFARTLFVQLKANDMIPSATAVAQLYQMAVRNEMSLKNFVTITQDFLPNAHVLLAEKNRPVMSIGRYQDEVNVEAFEKILSGYLQTTQAGKSIVDSGKPDGTHLELVIVGLPMVDIMTGEVVGSVFLLQPLVEVFAANRGLNMVMLLSAALSLLLMAPIVFFASRRLLRPLGRMRDVALTMAAGDFSSRADETQSGEFGQLGQSLNHLSKELARTISALRLERNRLRRVLDGLSEGIVAVDLAGNITHANPALLRLFHINPTDIHHVRDDLPKQREFFEAFAFAVQNQMPLERSIEMDDAILRMSIAPLEDEMGRVAGAVGLFRDITQSEHLEQTRRDYVANVSHELRTPLTSLRGLVEPLRDGLITKEEDRQRYYAIILRETLRLQRLIDDLLELSRLQSGKGMFEARIFDLRAVLGEIAVKYGSLADDMDMHFTLESPSCPPVTANPDRVEQVLVVLLDNALKFTKEGGHITLSAHVLGDHVRVSVADDGEGIAPVDLPHVFERFYKADRAHSGGGTGLGLSIAKEIMARMGQTLTVNSKQGQGAVFTFTLPIAEPSDKPDLE